MTLRHLVSAGALISLGMLAGRLLGLAREMLIAAQFGSGTEASMAIALLIIPDFVTATLIGSALSAVLLPAFIRRTEPQVMVLFWQMLWATFAILSLLTIIAALLIPEGAYSHAFIIVLLALPFTAATATLTAYLQHRGKLMVPAFANMIFNGVVLAVLWLAPAGLLLLAGGVVLAAFVRLAAHFWAFFRAGGIFVNVRSHSWRVPKPAFIAYLQISGASVLSVLPVYVPYAVVGAMSASAFAVFNYAFKLLVFPSILIQTFIQMALLPWFVRERSQSVTLPAERYSLSLQLGWGISLAVALAVSISGHDIADLCFGYGKMTAADVAAVGELLAVGIWVTPGAVLFSIWQQMLYAHEQPKPVLTANIALLLLLVTLCPLGNWLAGGEGVLAGFALAQTAPVLLLACLGSKHTGLSAVPGRIYIFITLAALAAFLPMAWLFTGIGHGSATGVLAAMAIGGITALCGLMACPPARGKLRAMLGRRTPSL